jgi:hypothetical protein
MTGSVTDTPQIQAYAWSENMRMLVLEPHHMRGLRSPQVLIVLGTMSYPLALNPAVSEDHVESDSLWVPDSRQQLSNSNTSVKQIENNLRVKGESEATYSHW